MKRILKTCSYNIPIYILCILCYTIGFAQEKAVHLVEEVQKKRTILYVQNDTNAEKSVFLKINPVGYRRSAQRPIIKTIPANSKIQMLTLIPLTDVASSYTYDLIVNAELQNIDVKKEKTKDVSSTPSSSKYGLLIYTEKDCATCDTLIQKLKNKKIDFIEIDIDSKHNQLSPQFWDSMYFKGYNRKNIRIPFAKKGNKLHHPITDFDKFIEVITRKKTSTSRLF
ncbi:hypothetical protein [Aquimarina sp. 2201CG14-23]|uniref:hypothetical protein n=1 Tax=Aquimarina mycalae TaxID=3040073 RepID=UPI002477E343|nr:hypothetical protein [Aquimarina sp. 2201CG14-23]MDH7444424.1 hypothetical protein [Aquimarina sp. 2201CG14-23]